MIRSLILSRFTTRITGLYGLIRRVADLLHTTPQELIGKCCQEVMRGDQECPANCPHLRALKTGKPSSIRNLQFQTWASLPRIGLARI